ncbi:hypothetical protein INS49_009681 [Diaporthe citri]|uniref:uncharacterized protein n=1 Tax=Diaporthe citri TaxID=83186 RepID=UPI001C800EFA|nr:uncharacterized protein INS49_009681 [Diaporthe citri]KAG6361454.1 hypothetical protein INS49_009681 [Diaporthe citri]
MERTAGLDGEAKGDGATFNVALFAPKEWAINVNPSSIGWAVTTNKSERDKGADSFKVVLLPEQMKKLQHQKSPILSSPCLETGSSTMEGFKKGKPLISLSTPIRACVGKSRPQVLYRAVHEEHPGNGLRSRGFTNIKTDQLSFMLHFHHHLNWKRRDASPFMSTTTDCAQAANVAAWYEREGFQSIEVLVIKADESEWRSQSTIWHVMQTAAKLGLTDVLKKAYCKSEYLIQDYIPASCVTRVRWEEMKADIEAETSEMGQSRKRKRSVFECDRPGDETVLSNERSRKAWGVVETCSRLKQQRYYIQREDLK